MAYATGADLVTRFDARVLADLVSDDNTSVEIADVASHPNIAAALEDASGDIDMALQASERYSATDLTSLTGNSLAALVRITCEIAASYLFGRRCDLHPETAEAQRKLAERNLQRLRKGEIVFALAPQQDAGLPDAPQFLQVDAAQSHLLRDRVKNYYPDRRYPART